MDPPDREDDADVLLKRRIAELESQIERLRENEDRFRALVSAGFEGLTVSVDGRIIEANDAAAALVGIPREELIGRIVFDLATPESAERVLYRIRQGLEEPYEIVARRPDGTTFPCEIVARNTVYQGKPARITAFRDISARKRAEEEKKRLEESMLHAQRLEQLGVLAGGIAHDFNNLALVILGHAELGLAEAADPSIRSHLEQIRVATLRASELTRQMLTYAGRVPTVLEPVNLGALVREMTELLRASVSKVADVQLQIDEGDLTVFGEPGQLRQIVMNLITNASDALDENGGTIRLHVGQRAVGVDELKEARLDATLGDGGYVSLDVSDTGCGMDAATQERIFDPFFSTKFSGRGLGLASVLGIVRGHHGAIWVRSEPSRGSHFTVLLPKPDRVHVTVTKSTPATSGIARCALVVDDQPMIRRLIDEFLRTLGFDVFTAADGRAALELFQTHSKDIDVIVLDMMMPGMGGAEALPEIRAIKKDVPVVLLSGFFNSDLPRETGDAHTAFLPKPFQTSELAAKVLELLGT